MTRTTRRATLAATIALTAALLAACSQTEEAYEPEPLPIPEETDIAYGEDRGCNVQSPENDKDCGGSQELDIYRSEVDGPNPVALWIHGGGFVGGDKADGVEKHFQTLLDDGWDIVAVNYRLATEDGHNQWPVPLQDVQRAVRWVKANAAAQDWDPERVAAIGHSAGGNLAGLLATTANDPSLTPPDLPPQLQEVDPSVVAAVALHAVSDLRLYSDSVFGLTLHTYLGCGDCPELLEAGSVQTHVDDESAPYLAINGVDDKIAAPEQAELVRDAYEAADIGDRFEMIVVDDGPQEFQGHMVDIKRFAPQILEFINDAADQATGDDTRFPWDSLFS